MPKEQQPKPLPAVDDLTRPFWEAAARHQLVVQRCQDCKYFNHPPLLVCDSCQSQRLTFVPVSGRGRIYTFTVMHQPTIAGFEQDIPYLNLLIELEEQSVQNELIRNIFVRYSFFVIVKIGKFKLVPKI